MRMVFSYRVGKLTAAIVAVFAVLATPSAHATPPIGDGVASYQIISPPTPAPAELDYVNEAGETVLLSDLQGKTVLINLWATWCAPCVREMPDLDALAARYEDDGLVVLTLSHDRSGRDVVDPFFEEHGLENLPRALDPNAKLGRALGVRGLPTSYVISAEGDVVGKLEGIAKWDGPDAHALMEYYLSR